MPLTHVEDDVADKVEFVLIDASGEFTKTLNLYCITYNTLTFFMTSIICMESIHIYMHIC